MRGLLAAAALCLSLAACSPSIKGVDEAALADAVGSAIGDPNTCVYLVNADGDLAWRYGNYITCSRQLPSCQGGGVTTVEDVANAAIRGRETAISCDSKPDGSATVGWAGGPVVAGPNAEHEPLFYAAVMEGERTLPGREISSRLKNAFARVGL